MVGLRNPEKNIVIESVKDHKGKLRKVVVRPRHPEDHTVTVSQMNDLYLNGIIPQYLWVALLQPSEPPYVTESRNNGIVVMYRKRGFLSQTKIGVPSSLWELYVDELLVPVLYPTTPDTAVGKALSYYLRYRDGRRS